MESIILYKQFNYMTNIVKNNLSRTEDFWSLNLVLVILYGYMSIFSA